ncbi:hypothetical protein GCM10023257_49990 [Streptomyces hyderabadensis]|uniref:Uncharacterized protein n=1 Tax=Streptomyces hyderabadensis TaxID=598549 RepID=A0ABP9IL07_9ACTN
MHHNVRTTQFLGDGRVPYVQDLPLRGLALPAPFVDRHDLSDLGGRGEPRGEQGPDPGGGTGDRDDGPARAGAGGTG